MKAPNMDALNALSKAPVTDPIINAGNTSTASPASADGTASGEPYSPIVKFTIRLEEELMGRIRAAYLADLATGTGVSSLSAWAADALRNAVIDAEKRHGRTEPFTPVGTGRVPQAPLGAR